MEQDASPTGAVTTRLIDRDDPAYPSAISLVLAGESSFNEGIRLRLEALEEIVSQQRLRCDLLVGAFRGDHLVSAALAVESPGRSAIVYIPPSSRNDRQFKGLEAAVTALTVEAHERQVVLAQALVLPEEHEQANVLSRVGFKYLAELIYMDRVLGAASPNFNACEELRELRFVTYRPVDRVLFRSAIAATYESSLDCPGLSALRTMDDVLAGHEATGIYDADGWIVAMHNGEPAGVVLLAVVPKRSAVEVVYMGVVPSARGKGVGNALLHKADLYALARRADVVTLAVDSTNAPARELYSRWQFKETGRRRAWIHTESQ